MSTKILLKWFMITRPALLTKISQMVYDRKACATYWNLTNGGFRNTVDSRYLEFDGTMDKIRVNRSSTQEELRKYRECSLFNDERKTTRAKFWRAKTSIACPYSRNDFKHIRCFCYCFFLSVKSFNLVKRLITSRYLRLSLLTHLRNET